MFKVIIAGGRKFQHTEKHYLFVEKLLANKLLDGVEFVSGEASGADQINWIMAQRTLGGFRAFPALWDRLDLDPCVIKTEADGSQYNALAGFNRNEQMAEYADALIAFPGGNGTKDMVERAKRHKLMIRRWK